MKTTRMMLALWLALLPLVGSMLTPVVAHAQAATFPTQPQCVVSVGPTASTSIGSWISLSQPNCQDVHYWTLTWIASLDVGTIPTCSVKAQQTSDKSSISDLITSQSCTTSSTTSTSVTDTNASYVRINLGTKSGTGTVIVLLNGYRQNPFGTINVAASSTTTGMVVTVSACSGSTCYNSPVNSGIVVLSAATTSTIFSATTMWTGMHCNNFGAAQVSFAATDGNNAYSIGGAGTAFLIPAGGFLDLPPGLIGQIMASGIKISSTLATVNCWLSGRQ